MEHMDAPRHLDDSQREISLEEACAQAWALVAESPARHSAITLIKREGLRVVLMAMAEGSVVPDHRTDAGFTVQVLRGALRFRVEGDERTLSRGHLLAVARGLSHDLRALEDAELLLTLSFAAEPPSDRH